MRFIRQILIFSLLLLPLPSAASDQPLRMTGMLDQLMERAIASSLISGGVAVIGTHEGIVHTVARGKVSEKPDAPAITERTVFDLASLTKVVATAPAVMKLVDEGKVSLTDPVSKWFPEFRKDGWDISVLHLLTHTSGLADFDLKPGQGIETAIRKAAAERKQPVGTSFNYADINFILLGEVVHRVTGKTLDAYTRDEIFIPLEARDTTFLPPRDATCIIAPTLGFTGGTVQDANCRKLGGVAGHAGLFSSGYDLSRYARMMLAGGSLDGKRIFSTETVQRMTTPYTPRSGKILRGLGWDIESPFSAPKGSYFSGSSFGHTGYSGSSIWIDPQQDLYVILLTIRTNYGDTKMFNKFRSDISTIASSSFGTAADSTALPPRWEVARIAAELQTPAPQARKEAPQPHRVVKVALAKHRLKKNRQVLLAKLDLKKHGKKKKGIRRQA